MNSPQRLPEMGAPRRSAPHRSEPRRSAPRRNGPAFDAPWQATVFALAAAVVRHALGGDAEPFRRELISAIAAEPSRPYWESWTAALEALVQALPER